MDSKLPSIFSGTHIFLSTQVLYQGILDVFADPESVVAIGKDSGFDWMGDIYHVPGKNLAEIIGESGWNHVITRKKSVTLTLIHI